jgi:hypothetical protein
MSEDEIVNVWEDSLEEEFDKIRRIIISYPYVAMVSLPKEYLKAYTYA